MKEREERKRGRNRSVRGWNWVCEERKLEAAHGAGAGDGDLPFPK